MIYIYIYFLRFGECLWCTLMTAIHVLYSVKLHTKIHVVIENA